MEGEVITEHRAKLRERKLVLGGSHARIIVIGDEAPQIRFADRRSQSCSRRQIVNGAGSVPAAHWAQSPPTWQQTTADRRKIGNLLDRHPRVRERERHSVAKTLRPLFGTHFRSRQSSPVFPRSDPAQYP
jgi:hypothetical protein